MPCRDDRAYEDAFDAFMKLRKICMEFNDSYQKVKYSAENHQRLTQAACEYFNKYNVKSFSLEAQIWWRDHQIADKKRKQQEEQDRNEILQLNNILISLTSDERRILRKHRMQL